MPDIVQGTQLLKASDVCERALRMIGAFSINDTAPRNNELNESLHWLDMMVAHLAGTGRCFWLVKDEQEITLEEDDGSYVVATELPDLKDGLQFPIAAMLEDTNGNRVPIEIWSQSKFRRIEDPTRSGTPTCIFIDRLNGPTMHVYPVPGEADEGKKIILTLQTFARSVRPSGTTGGSGLGNETLGIRAAWNLWSVYQLAAHIGSGAVRALPAPRVKLWQDQADKLKFDLEVFENREHDDEPPYVEPSVYQ